MAYKVYYCVCEDWSERVSVVSFGGDNRRQEREYALTVYKVCHGIFDVITVAQRKAEEVRQSIARNRAAQAPIVVIDPEQTMTAEEIKAGIEAGMRAEMEEREEQKSRRNARSMDE